MRDLLPRDKAERRNRECKRRYYETNKQLLREKARAVRLADPEYNQKRRNSYRKRIDLLIDAGVFQPGKRGRKKIYATPEEAAAAKKEQMKISQALRKERLAAALKALDEMTSREAQAESSSEESE